MNGSTFLEQRVERSMERLADAVESRLALVDVTARGRGAPDRPRRWLVGLAAASVALIGGGALWLRSPTSHTPASAPTTSIGAEAPSLPLYLPTSVPVGFELTFADRHEGSPTPNDAHGVVLAVPDSSGYHDPISVRLGADPLTDGEVVYDHEAVTLDDGTDADVLTDSTNGSTYLQWTAPGGDTIVVSNDVVTNQAGAADQLIEIANALSIDGTLVTVSGELPDGLEIVAAQPPTFPGTSVQLGYGNGDGLLLMVTVTVDPPAGWQYLHMSDRLDEITLRGREGFASEHLYPGGLQQVPTRRIMWLERPGVLVEVSGDGLTTEQLIAFAATLALVDEARWEEVTVTTATSTP